jgi:hypothetical protein
MVTIHVRRPAATDRRGARPGPVRAVGACRAVTGVVLVAQAPHLVRALRAPAGAVPVARLLGLRELLQAGVLAVRPSTTALRVSAVVDGLHLTSMLALAALSRKGRRPAATAGAQAAVELFADLALARTRGIRAGGAVPHGDDGAL